MVGTCVVERVEAALSVACSFVCSVCSRNNKVCCASGAKSKAHMHAEVREISCLTDYELTHHCLWHTSMHTT